MNKCTQTYSKSLREPANVFAAAFETQSCSDSTAVGLREYDSQGNLLVGGGDFGSGDLNYFALISSGALSNLLNNGTPININDPSQVRKWDPSSAAGSFYTLAQRVGAKVLGVYRMGLSEKTKKANAAFAGLGATKRIILGDTLLDKFAEDEIEVVMAHEMAHYKHGDISKLLAWSTATTFVGLWLADKGLRAGLSHFGFNQISDLGAFPLLALCLFVFGLVAMPVNNAFSRWRERLADLEALALTKNPDGFIRAMRKLADQNLADLAPHPAIEFLLHDHPSLSRRISWAEQWQRD